MRLKWIITRVLCSLLVFMMIAVQCFAFANTDQNSSSATAPVQSGVDEYTEDMFRIDYQEVASNDSSILYADMQKGFFALKNRSSGDIWYSTPNDSLQDIYTRGADKWGLRSQIAINYLFEEDILTAEAMQSTNSQLGCIEEGKISVQKIKNGISVLYDFSVLGIKIPVSYVLKKNYLVASIDIANIKEENKCYLTDISLLPSFGAANWEAEGQLLVPDGTGALIDFNNGKDCKPYESEIYGNDAVFFPEMDKTREQAVRLPVFATMYQNKSLMGIVTKGDSSASIRAVNGNVNRGYNAVSSKINLRYLETISMFKRQLNNMRKISRLTDALDGVTSYEVRYYSLSGQNINYADIATEYRNYLVEEKGLAAHPEKPALAVELYGAIDKKSAFLGFEYDKKIALTTFEQAQKIIEDLQKVGVDQFAVRYMGWGNNGLLNDKLPAKANAMQVLGENDKFESFAAFMQNLNNSFYPDVDFIQYRKGSKSNAIKNVFNEVVYHNERMRSVFVTRLDLDPVMYLIPQKIVSVAEKYLKSYRALSVGSISLSTLGSFNYSNNTTENEFHRYFFADEVTKVIQKYKKANLNIALEDANAYAIPFADRIYNAPTVCSGFDIFDEEIPFYQMVTHGYVTTTVMPMAEANNQKVNFLKAVESGSELLYSGMYAQSNVITGSRYDQLYGTQYQLWLADAKEAYKRYQPLLEKIYDKPIVSHTVLAKDVTKTVFEGGTGVVVNYNDEKVTVGGYEIPGLDYLVIEEDVR